MPRKCYALVTLVSPLLGLLAGCGAPVHQGLARGKDLYNTCVPCHGRDGYGNQTLGAPAIAGLPEWYVAGQLHKFQKGIRGAHPDDNEGARMRPMARSLNLPGDVESVAQYVATMKSSHGFSTLSGGNVAAGQTRFTSICFTCHGPQAQGNPDLKAPRLTAQADWYMLAQLQKFKDGLRGANAEDTTGQQMRVMASTLEDRQAMLDVIAYIRTLSQNP